MNNEEWIRPNTKTGPPAEGIFYYNRKSINKDFWSLVKKGHHILFTAPRRIGKTSVMINLAKNRNTGFLCFFENIESVNSSNGFYKRLFNILVKLLKSKKKVQKQFNNWLKSKEIEEASLEGVIKFKHKDVDYKAELLSLIRELVNLEQNVIIFLDEFPEVLNTLIKKSKTDDAIDILHTIREIRQDSDFKNIILVLAGSIGLEYIIEQVDRPKLIMDLHNLKIPPLTVDEAMEMIGQITQGATLNIDEEMKVYLINRIKHLLPYFIQLVIEECDNILSRDDRPNLKTGDVDLAFINIIKHHDNKLYDWESRLNQYLPQKAYAFCKEILTLVAHKKRIDIQQIFDLSGKYDQRDNYMRILKMLEREGYITGDREGYQFVSPIIRLWWQKQHPEFEIGL